MAFRTRCPSCGTLFSAPDNMLENEIKCPRCKSFFTAREEPSESEPAPEEEFRPGGVLPSEQRAPAESGSPTGTPPPSPSSGVKYYCTVCNAPFNEEDILDGLAVKRFDEVYCRKHFKLNFSDECEKHPGTKAITQCGRCGMPICQNCVVELQDEQLCSRCKRRVLGELRGDYAPGEAFGFGNRPGLPWEQANKSFIGSMAETIKEVLFTPGLAFQKMHVRGGYGKPLLFAFILTTAGTFLAYIYQIGIMGATTGFGSFTRTQAGITVTIAVLYFVLAAFGALVGPFIQAAILHVSLMILKGAKNDYECTYRVIAYATGSTTVFNVVPIIGPFIGGIWSIVAIIIGFSRAHTISGGKAALAFFLPFIVCCGGYIAFFLLILAAAGTSGF